MLALIYTKAMKAKTTKRIINELRNLRISVGSCILWLCDPFCRCFMRPFLLFMLIGLGVLPASEAFAVAPNGCPNYVEPEIKVTPVFLKPRFDTSKNLAAIQAMSRAENDKYISSKHEVPVGLTSSGLLINADYSIRVKSTSDSPMVCAQISTFELRFGFEDIVVYVASEVPRNSCGYDLVLNHELQHVAIDQKLTQVYDSTFPGLVRRAVERVGVIRAGSSAEAEAQIKRDIGVYIKNFGENLSAEREKRQKQIDTEAEYKRLSQSCGGELGRITGQNAALRR